MAVETKEPWSHCCSNNPEVVKERKCSYKMLEDLIKPIQEGKQHRVPRWLLRRIKKIDQVSTEWAARDQLDKGVTWLDHWGTIKVCGVEVLVSEPYIDFHGKDQAKIHGIAERYGCRAVIFPTGIWCLTAYRIVFVPIDWDTSVNQNAEGHWIGRLFESQLTRLRKMWGN